MLLYSDKKKLYSSKCRRKEQSRLGMIREENKHFILETKNTSYIFYIDEQGLLRHLYYGKKISVSGDSFLALQQKTPNPNGCSAVFSKDVPILSLDDTCLEFSTKVISGL